MHNRAEERRTDVFCTSDRATSRRVGKFLRVVPANNRTRGERERERTGRNHLGIPFNRAVSETNCGLTVCWLQPGGRGCGVSA